MVIQSVTVEQFAALYAPITVEFEDGLNVIYGPNETGKSTLMRAIWYAFTRRAGSRAQEIKAIEPERGGTPSVTVTWEQEGPTFTLTKVFSSSSPETRLEERTRDGSLRTESGEEADDRLREVLGFGAPSGRTKTPAHFGLWPVIWVRQGERTADPARRLDEEGDRESLSEVLADLSGKVLAGADGEGILERAREEYERFYTAQGNETQRSGAPLHEAQKRLEDAREEKHRLQDRQRRYETDLQRFESVRVERRELESELPDLKKEAREAAEQREQVQQIRGELDTLEARLEQAEALVERLEKEREQRRQIREAIERLDEEIEEREGERDSKQDHLERHRRRREEIDERRADAERGRTEARRRARLLEAHQTVVQGRDRAKELRDRLERVEEHRDELARVAARLEQISVDEEELEELESLARQRDRAEATLESASAEVHLRGREAVSVRITDELFELESGEEIRRLIDVPTSILVDDRLEIEVVPGGEELTQVRRAAEEARVAYREALEAAEVESLEEARRLLRERSRLATRREDLDDLIEEAAPDGVQELRGRVSSEEARLKEARSRRSDLQEDLDLDLPEEEAEVRSALQRARERAEAAEGRFEEVREELNAHDREAEQLKGARQMAEQSLENARRRRSERRDELEDRLEAEGSDDELDRRLDDARAEVEDRSARVESLRSRLEKLDAGDVEVRVERARRAVEHAEEELGELREEIAALRARLGSVELHGLHERMEEANQEVDAARREVDRWEDRAEAARLLYETLDAARTDVQREFLAPLRREVEDLLGQFFGISEVGLSFEEDFSVQRLSRRAEGTFSFDLLSTGAREQLALIVRLAMVRLLSEDRPLPVVLDEVLADTDPVRFEAMANLLRRVSEDVQIVLTTCHKNRFRRVGADREIDLEAVKRRAVPGSGEGDR